MREFAWLLVAVIIILSLALHYHTWSRCASDEVYLPRDGVCIKG